MAVVAAKSQEQPRPGAAGARIRVPVRLEEAAILTDYAVTTRYPEDWDPIDETEYERALLLAQHVYEWVLSVMQQNPKM